MKLNKVNKNGSLSVILPINISTSMFWTEGQEVKIDANTNNSILIQKQGLEKEQDFKQILDSLRVSLNSFEQVLEQTKDNPILRQLLKTHLLTIMEQL